MNQVAKILTAQEPWVEYQLDDGTLLRFRFTACQFRRTGNKTAQGDPEYGFSQSLLCETHVPPVVAEVRQLRAVQGPRLAADAVLAEGFTMTGDPEPIGGQYVAPDSDVG